MPYRRLFLLLVGVLVSCTSGCTIWRPANPKLLTERAVAYNLAAADAQKKLLLLNIVRAMQYEPRYFTSITQIREAPDVSVSPSLSIPFGGDAPSLFGLGLAAKRDNSTWSADIAVLDSQEFTKGLLEPVSLDVIDYFWQQGWSRELLLTLLVRRIGLPGGKSVVNHPESPEAMADFHKTVEELLSQDLRIESAPATLVGEFLQGEPNLELGELVLKAYQQGLKVEIKDGRYTLLKPSGAKKLVWGSKDKSPCARPFESPSVTAAVEDAKFYFRSAEGVIYFLGQIMRDQQCDPKRLTWIHKDRENSPPKDQPYAIADLEQKALFVACSQQNLQQPTVPPMVQVTYKGVTYTIPATTADLPHYSMSILTLVSQLIDLNKLRSQLPTTGVVTVVGGG